MYDISTSAQLGQQFVSGIRKTKYCYFQINFDINFNSKKKKTCIPCIMEYFRSNGMSDESFIYDCTNPIFGGANFASAFFPWFVSIPNESHSIWKWLMRLIFFIFRCRMSIHCVPGIWWYTRDVRLSSVIERVFRKQMPPVEYIYINHFRRLYAPKSSYLTSVWVPLQHNRMATIFLEHKINFNC